MITLSLCISLNITDRKIKDVEVMQFNGNPAYQGLPHNPLGDFMFERGPWAVLTEVSARSNREAHAAMKGVIENEPLLAWTQGFPGVEAFLAGQNPW